MIYGYLRVSSDKQEIESQKQGVDEFAKQKNWNIDKYISDEGVSGGKDPSKRKLGPMLESLQQGDIVIAAEISRLGRDLYMVMDILHLCMTRGVIVYTVKDRFVLGDDIQSKVLAFAFGLSAEVERQMIRQRTAEGLRLRMKMGVLVGRPPIGYSEESKDNQKAAAAKEDLLQMYRWGVPLRRMVQNTGIARNTIARYLLKWGAREDEGNVQELRKALKKRKDEEKRRRDEVRYKSGKYCVVALDANKMIEAIKADMTLPEIQRQVFPEYTYEQVYDTCLVTKEFNTLYREHAQKLLKKKK